MNSSSIRSATTAGLLVAISVAIGCAHDETKPVVAPTAAAPQGALAAATPGKSNSSIYLSDQLRAACGIAVIESVKEAPKFEFDQSAILPEDRDVLAQVATCLTTGPLKGRSVKLIGRADPRGTPEYNMALGEHRSNAVMRYLSNLGVSGKQMTETSRGSLDATGGDESAWRQDRRVDVDVMGTTD